MPLVAHSHLPTYDILRALGHDVLSLDRALSQDIREMHIGLLNMMPDAALRVTERQYMRLVGSANQIVQFYVHPFTIEGLERSADVQAYIDTYYHTFDELREQGLDALIVTGANVTNPSLELEPFWEPLQEVMAWASESVTSILCSCLATHALLKFKHGINRQRLPAKQWGVYSHKVLDRTHPLLRDINTRFDVPHSRWNEVTADDIEAAGLRTLVTSEEAGVQLAVSPDQFRIIYFQGHPEYFYNSLLKEYKREVFRFLNGDIASEPPFPDNYFSAEAVALARDFLRQAQRAYADGQPLPTFPEAAFDALLDNTWGDTGKAIINNWLGLIYQLTDQDRHQPFMAEVDPADPLNLNILATPNGTPVNGKFHTYKEKV